MKGIFITIDTPSKEDHSGVGQKIRNQIACLNSAGLNCNEVTIPQQKGRLLSAGYRLPFFSAYQFSPFMNELKNSDYIYLRRPYVMNAELRKAFRDIKKANPACKIIMELPTYPYDKEYQVKKLSRMILLKDSFNRTRMSGLIDRFTILTDESEIWGIPAIKIYNGIDVDKIKKREPVKNDDAIHICAVAMFCEWHGYERIIEGLHRYYQDGGKRNLIFHFAGEGPELATYKELVEKNDLGMHIIFHGRLDGEALSGIYNISDIALGSFGMYKIGINLSCNLKSREAVARGIPSVTGCPTDIFDKKKFKYFYEFPNDQSIVDIQKIIDFNDQIYKEGAEKVISDIRQYAYETVTMEAAMKNVVDYIKS